MAVSQYRLTVIGPQDEVLDEIPLDGLDLNAYRQEGPALASDIASAMGSEHVRACAALTGSDG